MKIKTVFILAVSVLFFLAAGGSAPAQNKAPSAKPVKIKVVGKIVKDESMGGYYIQGKKPREIFRIVNQDPKILEKYAKSDKDVTIEAHSTMGDNLVIEKIQGKKYKEAMKK